VLASLALLFLLQEPALLTPEPPPSWWERDLLTGSWMGRRDALGEAGVQVDLQLIQDLFVARGGLEDGEAHMRYAEVGVGLDLEALLGLSGTTFFVDAYHTAGDSLSALLGDWQVASNIDSDPVDVLAELWLEQAGAGGAYRVKVGKMDVNSEFAFVDNGGEFLNSSMGFSPTIFALPTFPLPAFGALVEGHAGAFHARLGVFDGAGATGYDTGGNGPSFWSDHPTSAFYIGEVGVRWEGSAPGRLAVGHWHHNADFDRFDGGVDDDAQGQYLVLDQHLASDLAGRDLGLYGQLGLADERVSEVGVHLGAGLVWLSPDTGTGAGLGVTGVEFTDEPAAGFSADRELTVELFWRAQPLGWLSVKPDLQYITNPGGDASVDDAVALGLRLEWIF
jgi:carbohydrate-selective porin OprB